MSVYKITIISFSRKHGAKAAAENIMDANCHASVKNARADNSSLGIRRARTVACSQSLIWICLCSGERKSAESARAESKKKENGAPLGWRNENE